MLHLRKSRNHLKLDIRSTFPLQVKKNDVRPQSWMHIRSLTVLVLAGDGWAGMWGGEEGTTHKIELAEKLWVQQRVCVCVCERERETETDRQREK